MSATVQTKTARSAPPKPNAKRQKILEVAGKMFIQTGFKAVSMDAIAEAAPVSKATLYNHFTDKKDLFFAVVQNRCRNWAEILEKHLDLTQDPEQVLTFISGEFLNLVFSPDAINIHRVIVSESKEFPELGKLFYESGPKKSHALLAAYLTEMHKSKKLYVPEPELSASMLFNTLKGMSHIERLLGLKTSISPEEKTRVVNHTVSTFLRAHKV